MSSVLIPKDREQDYQPWEMLDLESGRRGVTTDHTVLSLPTIDQVTQIQEQARQEAFALGRAEGHAQGLAEGRAEIAREVARLGGIAEAFQSEMARADENISHEVLELALDLARAMLKTALNAHPEVILPIVREAISYLPGVQQAALLFLHPEDAALVRTKMGGELEKTGWIIAEDGSLERGGCRVETRSNQLDADVPSRWRRLAAALGKQSDWLAP